MEKDNCLKKAGLALEYAVKSNQNYKFYTPNIDMTRLYKVEERHKEILVNAIENDLVFPVFHPIVDREENIVKYEVLMRISNIEEGKEEVFYPKDFLKVSIRTKQYNQLSKIIFDKAFSIMERSKKNFTLNISYNDIYNSFIAEVLEENLERYKQIGRRLTIELLEDDSIKDFSLVNKFIERFKQYGIKIAIDDFGSGYSNLSNILNIDADYIKIDGELIKHILSHQKSYVMVRSIADLAKEIDMRVIAEHVHSKEIFDQLKEMGIDEYQGYYFYKPSRVLQ